MQVNVEANVKYLVPTFPITRTNQELKLREELGHRGL